MVVNIDELIDKEKSKGIEEEIDEKLSSKRVLAKLSKDGYSEIIFDNPLEKDGTNTLIDLIKKYDNKNPSYEFVLWTNDGEKHRKLLVKKNENKI